MSRDGVCRQRGCILEDLLLPETRNLHQREKNLVRRAFHARKIMHRDMKSANIFLFKDMQAKLGDLNVSKIVKKGLSYT
jgi:serine/threonine protein kinase